MKETKRKVRVVMTNRNRLTRALPLLLIVFSACTGSRAFREAREEEALGHWDLAVYRIQKVGYESIDVGFVGFPPTESRRLGIS